jgi:large subunit ribosomal protein L32
MFRRESHCGFGLEIFGVVSMLPGKKTSKSRTRTRRAHHALKPVNYSTCVKCNHAKLPHAACDNCGYLNPKTTLKLGKEEGE